jgi:tetratricopeptide (TPR) repeat protein/ADP-heptose:LPS heptosyltransferase
MGVLRRLFGPSAARTIPQGRAAPSVAAPAKPRERELVEAAIERCNDAARAGRLAESLQIVNAALQGTPTDARLLYARALTLFDWGRHFEARRDLIAAHGAGLDSFGLHLNLGEALRQAGAALDAERHLRQAVARMPEVARGHLALGILLQGERRHDEAIECFRRTLELAPDLHDCLTYITASLLDNKKPIEAETIAREAIASHGQSRARIYGLLAMALAMQNRRTEALEAYKHAESLESADNDEVFANFGFNLIWMNRPAEAIEIFRRHLPGHPHLNSMANYGGACLTLGWLNEGWRYYEFRWAHEPLLSLRPQFPAPRWDGQDIAGKTVLVWAEQGVGDLIQFVRFIGPLKARGATVILLVGESVREFARNLPHVDSIVVNAAEIAGHYDFNIPLLSLPLALGIDLQSVSTEIPYVRLDDARVAAWRRRLAGTGLNVGLVWSGNPKHERDAYRSIPLRTLAPLFDLDGVLWHSLQKDPRAEDRETMATVSVIDVATELDDFRDTAAAIEALDLVVTVDTAVAHLAGALGKPVWVLLPEACDFRWLIDREDSPWYPTMRLFRQSQLGEWSDVVQRVTAALVHWLEHGEPPAATPACAPTADVRPIEGLTLLAETRWGLMQYRPGLDEEATGLSYYGEHLQRQIEVLGYVIPVDGHVLEVGAGAGGHAVALAHVLETGHVWLYEDDPYRRQLLKQNLALNGLLGRTTIMRGRLAAASPLASAAPQPAAETIDDLLLERLDLLKIATAGRAQDVLSGAQATIWRLRPSLFLAARDAVELQHLAANVHEFGYRAWQVATGLFSPDNYNRRSDDRFGGRRALALLAVPEELPDRAMSAVIGPEL